MTYKAQLIILLTVLSFTSCLTPQSMKSIQVELLKPALFAMPDDIDTIAILKRDYFKTDTVTFKYFDVDNEKMRFDKNIRYADLSNLCVASLTDFLEKEGYFLKVINYSDSLNYMFSSEDSLFKYPELCQNLGIDAFIFLDYFTLDDKLTHNTYYDFGSNIIRRFPEFRYSIHLESVTANLFWTVAFKCDSSVFICKQPDDLYYGNSIYPELFGNEENHRKLIQNTAGYLGKAFGAKIVPTWLKVERTFYRSKKVNMLLAENYCMKGEWLKAAEIYKMESKNKKLNIAVKAKYNMALICEMEGNTDAAIEWLIDSYSSCRQSNTEHKFICKQYIDLLAKRRKEIELLAKQVRTPKNS